MAKNPNHARQFKHRVLRPTDIPGPTILKWLYTNYGKSSIMDLHNGVWFFDAGNQYPYESAYYFKHEKDAVYFKMTWE